MQWKAQKQKQRQARQQVRHQHVLWVLVAGLLCCTGWITSGCLDQRSPRGSRRAVVRSLTAREKQQVQRAMLTNIPIPRYRLNNAVLSLGRAGMVKLHGIDVKPYPLQRGKKATITYYFEPLRRFKDRWGIFLHLEGEPGFRFYKTYDHHPVNGLHHTRRWVPKKAFKSSFSFTFPKDFPGQKAHFYSGMWRGNTRLTVPKTVPNDGNNRVLLARVPVAGEGLKRPIYVAYRVATPPKIDGDLGDKIWTKLPSTGRLRTYNNKKARFRTEIKLGWDDNYLYAAFIMEDDDIWSTYTKRDDPLFKQENIEFFIDANRNRKDYIELQVSPAKVIFDSFFERYRYPKPWGRLSYNSGMDVAVRVDGTLNNKKDKDRGWTVEMRLPLRKLGPAPHMPPHNGDEWLINFFRLERSRLTGAEDHAWSPVTLGRGGDYHNINRFGTLRFSTEVRGQKLVKGPKPPVRTTQNKPAPSPTRAGTGQPSPRLAYPLKKPTVFLRNPNRRILRFRHPLVHRPKPRLIPYIKNVPPEIAKKLRAEYEARMRRKAAQKARIHTLAPTSRPASR